MVAATTAAVATTVNARVSGELRSVPAVSACTVVAPNTTNDPRWIACQRRRDSTRMRNDVAWTMTSTSKATMPQASAVGR